MLKRFFPKLYERSVFTIDYKTLYSNGIRYLIFDVDNTLVPFDITEPTEQVLKLAGKLKKMGFTICLLSNNKFERIDKFNKNLGVYAVWKARKPGRSGVMKALSAIGGAAEKTAIIGDQLFTDIWCGNRSALYTILVTPVSNRDEWTVKLKRLPEKFVFKRYLKQCGKAGSVNDKWKNKR